MISSLDDAKPFIEFAIGIGTLLGLLYAGWRWFIRWFSPWWRKKTQPLVDALEAFLVLPQMHMQIGVVAREVQTNGGGSLKDAVLDGRHRLILMEATIRARADSDPNTAMFECGPDGQNTFVSETYCRWLGVGRDELRGWGFLSYVHEGDREELREEWDSCRADRRVYQRRHRMVAADGEVIAVETVVRPIPESGPVQRWIGVMRRV